MKFFFAALFSLFTGSVLAVIIEAPNLSVIEKEIEHLDNNALVVFDVDCTLIVPKDCILGPWGDNYFCMQMSRLHPVHSEELFSKVLLQRKIKLVEDQVLSLLERLKQKGIRTVALTAIRTGRFGLIPSMEGWRVDQLNELGIHFGWSFPHLESITFSQFFESAPPVYKEGVIASSRVPKGIVLTEFLKHVQWTPSKIIFIDDYLDFIESVEEELEWENIPHISFYYTAAADQPCQLNLEMAEWQVNHLLKEGNWLSDEEVYELIKTRPIPEGQFSNN